MKPLLFLLLVGCQSSNYEELKSDKLRLEGLLIKANNQIKIQDSIYKNCFCYGK